MTHPYEIACGKRHQNGPRAIPDCHLWDMAQRILEVRISGQISRVYELFTATLSLRSCRQLNQGGNSFSALAASTKWETANRSVSVVRRFLQEEADFPGLQTSR